MISRIAAGLLRRLSRSSRVQDLLARNVEFSHGLMGIGSGSTAEVSGERVLIRLLRDQAEPDRPLTVFDVGANQGQFLEMVRVGLAGQAYRIHAFEPGRRTFATLAGLAGDDGDVTLNNAAMGSAPGELVLNYDSAGSGMASLYKRRLDHFGIALEHSERVAVETLDRYCATHEITSIDLLKLDVEGHELEVLRGASRLFSQQAIRMVSFEFGGCNIDSRTFFQDFYYFFTERGMSAIYRIAPSGNLVPIERYREIDEQFRTTNFLVLQDRERRSPDLTFLPSGRIVG
jgi:FkbM family methyltransferase